jgi:hypothetical protein
MLFRRVDLDAMFSPSNPPRGKPAGGDSGSSGATITRRRRLT